MWRIIEDIFIKFPILPLYALAWVIGVFYFKKYFDTVLRHFPLIIGYTFLTELLGFLVKNYPEFTFFTDPRFDWHNIIIYNIYGLVTMFYFTWIYYRLLVSEKFKRIILFGLATYLVCTVICLFYQDPLHEVLLYPAIIESLSIALAALLHIKELRGIANIAPQNYNLMFWVDRGLLAFHIPFPIIYFSAVNIFREVYLPFRFSDLHNITIAAMYVLFIIGFIRSSRPAFR